MAAEGPCGVSLLSHLEHGHECPVSDGTGRACLQQDRRFSTRDAEFMRGYQGRRFSVVGFRDVSWVVMIVQSRILINALSIQLI